MGITFNAISVNNQLDNAGDDIELNFVKPPGYNGKTCVLKPFGESGYTNLERTLKKAWKRAAPESKKTRKDSKKDGKKDAVFVDELLKVFQTSDARIDMLEQRVFQQNVEIGK